MPRGLILAIRLDGANQNALDYFLIPTREMKKDKIRFTTAGLPRVEPFCHFSLSSAGKAILKHIFRAKTLRTRCKRRLAGACPKNHTQLG